MARGIKQARRHLMLALVALALAARVLVPAGWMPSNETGRATLTLCTGAGMVEAWIDGDGKIHKSSPDKGSKAPGACVFASLTLALGTVALGFAIAATYRRSAVNHFAIRLVTIGRGLAAPPPPARGSPVLI